jgi:hypothetical protein
MRQPRHRIHLLATIACGLALTAHLHAQEHAPDADVTTDRVFSISILPTPNAPFTATVVTSMTTIQPNGSKRTTYNRRIVARDSSGRVFQERRYLTPTGDTEPSPLSLLQYEDPNRHRTYRCDPIQHICNLYEFYLQKPAPLTPVSSSPNSAGTMTREDLGRRTQDTLELIGSRETTTVPAGAIGDEKLAPLVKEFWYSPDLGINVLTTRSDPRVSALQSFSVENIDLKEPNPKLFNPPSDYRVLDATQSNSPTITVYNEYVTCPLFGGCIGITRPVIIHRGPTPHPVPPPHAR